MGLERRKEDEESPFILDINRIREEARRDIGAGPLTSSLHADIKVLIPMLQSALATEWLCVLRYTQHYFAAQGIDSDPVKKEFLEHADQERAHALKLAKRIRQLGGIARMDPLGLTERSHTDYSECDTLVGMIQENLVAERIAVATYQEMIRYVGAADPTTRRLLEGILEQEEEHADELWDLISTLDPKRSPRH